MKVKVTVRKDIQGAERLLEQVNKPLAEDSLKVGFQVRSSSTEGFIGLMLK